MVRSRLILILRGIEDYYCNAYLDSTLATVPFVGYVIDVSIPREFKTNFVGHELDFPTDIFPRSLKSHIVRLSVRGVVFQTDGSIHVWVGPDFEVNYPLEEIATHFRSAEWEVPKGWIRSN
jgi:hypothetical protein